MDAQLGMATVFARMGDSTSAARHYRQVLVIDPRNGAALAGLLAVRDSRSPSLEVELKTLVGRNPEAASLRFTLGNLYAAERRWVEAQQAYFEAYRLEPDNADYMYNLAVSLDQLKQPKLALEYYLKALASQPKSGGQFDPAVVARRIKDLPTDSRNN
jgi:tetratricopeptide (TPR) repeat protein